MSLINVVTSVAILICFGNADELPSYFLKCRKSDPYLGHCVAASTNKALKYFAKGDPAYDIPSFNPLHIPLISISTHGIKANLFNATVGGISDSIIMGAHMNFEDRNFAFVIKTPVINIASNYSVNGRIFMLPIILDGTANITFDKLNLRFSFMYNLVNFKGEEYIQLSNATLIYAFENISMDLENLTNISKTATSTLDELFSKNMLGLDEQISARIGESLAEAIAKILGNLFGRVPFSELFDE